MQKTINLISFLFLFLFAAAVSADDPIKHKMLLLDESRKQIVYVDQYEPANNWISLSADGALWDAQLIGDHKILVAVTDKGGYREYNIGDLKKAPAERKPVREVTAAKYKSTQSAIRFPDGRTVIAVNAGKNSIFYVFNKNGEEINAIKHSGIQGVRLVRRSPHDTLLVGDRTGRAWEIDLDGKEIRCVDVPGSHRKYIYQVKELPNGHWLAATGYDCRILEIDKENKTVRTLGGNPAPEGLTYIFFSKFQVLPNGHIVVATWTGHGAEDSRKGQQLVQFDKEGKVVWQWHDPALAGSLNGVIILDDLDTAKWNEE
ncbi:MAG: hypothetical protein LBH00_02140 [Planctomycetaceae bacterium]|jgi:WD40 repeat protein|nr:hypothetical protein [Planctomycetaceae bacterium]